MLMHTLTHYTEDDEDPETNVFYQTLISRIDEMTHLANANGNGIELEYDEEGKKLSSDWWECRVEEEVGAIGGEAGLVGTIRCRRLSLEN